LWELITWPEDAAGPPGAKAWIVSWPPGPIAVEMTRPTSACPPPGRGFVAVPG